MLGNVRFASDRAGVAADEAADLGRYGAVFLLIDPPGGALLSAVRAAQATVAAGLPSTVDQWAALVPLGLNFATVGEAAARLQQFNTIRESTRNTPDGGMAEHTLAELAGLVPAS